MARQRIKDDEPVIHLGVSGDAHISDWSSWFPSKHNPRLCPPGEVIRSCGVPGCHRHQVRPR